MPRGAIADSNPNDWLAATGKDRLAAYATYCGTGSRTAFGMGQTPPLAHRRGAAFVSGHAAPARGRGLIYDRVRVC